jgi:hypothetical protein
VLGFPCLKIETLRLRSGQALATQILYASDASNFYGLLLSDLNHIQKRWTRRRLNSKVGPR